MIAFAQRNQTVSTLAIICAWARSTIDQSLPAVSEDSEAYNSPDVWRDAQRHRTACAILARQIALKEAGTMADEYFARYRARLLAP